VHGNVVDALTSQPTACTVTIVDSTGDTVTESRSFTKGFRCDGHFVKRLPAGRARIRVTRGFETRAVEQAIQIPADGEVVVRIALERVVDLRQRGWYAGDSHAHMLHGERTLPVDFDFVALTARAEDLQYLSIAQAWSVDEPTPERLEAELQSRSRPDCFLTWNLEAPKNYYRGDAGRCLGHCWTLGMRGRTREGHDVLALLLEASAHDYESAKPTYANFESHQLIRSEGGAVFYTHPARWWTGPWGGRGGYPEQLQMRVSNMAVELPLDTLLGPTYDGIDLMTTGGEHEANALAFQLWCLLLNHGYRLAGTASSDACFDRPGGGIPGIVRTYTHVGTDFSLKAVTQAAAQGKNFVTSGPLVLASVGGAPPGTTFPADGQPRRLEIEAWASGADPGGLSRIEVLRSGQPFHAFEFSNGRSSVATNVLVSDQRTAWYCVRAYGSDARQQRATTGAFFFDAPGQQPPSPCPAKVRVVLQDARRGTRLSGSVAEVFCHGPVHRDGQRHEVDESGEATVTVPGTARLRAEAPGYQPLMLSPVLDSSGLIEFITGLTANDLVNWETYERTRELLSGITLQFALEPQP
jgi:hypothetical protein